MHIPGGIILQASADIPLQLTTVNSSRQSAIINELNACFFWAAGAVLLIVLLLTAFMITRYHHAKNNFDAYKQPGKKWEFVMLGVPLLLVAFFFVKSIQVTSQLAPADKGRTPDIIITGHQWWWEAYYPRSSVTTANEIHLPANKNLLLQFRSADVIHSWWLPQMGGKIDLVPNRDNFLSLQVTRPGVYYGTCSEFCGDQHAYMRIIVYADTEPAFRHWLAAQQQNPVLQPSVVAGKNLFQSKTCSNCYRIKGTSAAGSSGPYLTHLASRQTILSGRLKNNRSDLLHWLQHPQQVKPGAYMPDFNLQDSTMQAITGYLLSLK